MCFIFNARIHDMVAALSRMPNRNHNKDVELDVRVDGIAIHDNPECITCQDSLSQRPSISK